TPGTIEGDIQAYLNQYGHLIQGFFIDQMFMHAAFPDQGLTNNLVYYQSIYKYIKGLSSSYTVVGNQGSPFLNGLTPGEFLSTTAGLNIFEGPQVPLPSAPGVGFNLYPYGVDWFQSYNNSHFSNIVFDVPTASAMSADLIKAAGLHAGSVFITDQTLPNPYSQLPSYWDHEVAAIAAFVPEPGAFTKLASGGLCAALAMAVRRWSRRRGQA